MKTITRKRLTKTRYEISNGPCFIGLHFWKYSIYVGKPVKRLNTRLKAIKDANGSETISIAGGA